ncbi:DUF3231 family protein [Filobacillus milosensis]|nr:DUF3231 family protein [Filobacillus milosensis]
MENSQDTRLTSAEIGGLWSCYLNNTMSICTLKYFKNIVEDEQTKSIIEYALELSNEYLERVTNILKAEEFPIPQGFTQADVNLEAPRLFTDIFILNFAKSMAKIGLGTYSLCYSLSSRNDVRELYRYCMKTTTDLDERSVNLLKNKGLYIRPPYITYPRKVRFVTKKKFLDGLGKNKRPLTAHEITHLFSNLDTNILGHMLAIGFAQVADDKEVQKILWKGKRMSEKQRKVFSDKLLDENLPSPGTWDSGVTKATESPFSDKLMLYMISFLTAASLGNYGLAMGASPRMDLGSSYSKLMTEVSSFAKEVADLMIEKGWLEEPPQAENREDLADL